MGCINELKYRSIEELRRHSIYYFSTDEEFKAQIDKGADYEFAVICADSDIEFLGNLKKAFESDTIDDDLKWKIVQTIERLPGRIIIVGEKPDSWNNFINNECNNGVDELCLFRRWLTRRICWIKSIDINSFNLQENDNSITPPDNEQEKFKLKLYELWVEHIARERSFEIEVNLGGMPSADLIVEIVKSNKEKIAYEIYELVKDNEEITFEWILGVLEKFILKKKFITEKFKNEVLEENKNISHLIEKFKEGEFFYEENTSYNIYNQFSLWFNIEENKIKRKFSKYFELKTPFSSQKSTSEGEYEFRLGNEEPYTLFYSRHEKINSTKLNDKKNNEFAECNQNRYFYGESLSGASPFFPILESELQRNKYKMIYRLFENGILRVLIADERIARYCSENEDFKLSLEAGGVDVLKNIDGLEIGRGKSVEIGDFSKDSLYSLGDLKDLYKKQVYDVFIIHQGILDKIREKHNLKKEDFKEILQMWREKYFPFIIVTSGRGMPEEVHDEVVKFLPFSSIEQVLMSKPHQKIVLSYLIMKTIFPIGGSK